MGLGAFDQFIEPGENDFGARVLILLILWRLLKHTFRIVMNHETWGIGEATEL